MKKLIIVLLVIACVSPKTVNAQTEEGTIFVSMSTSVLGTQNLASVSFTSSKFKAGNTTTDAGNTFSLGLTPRVGYFIMDNILVGAGLGFQVSKSTDAAGDNSTTVTGFNAGPFGRYYIALDGFNPFVEAGINFGSLKFKDDVAGTVTENKNGLLSLKLGVGSSFFIGEKASFDVFAGYQRIRTQDADVTDPPKTITGGIAIDLGISIFL